ncbi:MAG: helix-turn-helix domain-containing protein [Gammaproteobacteria bacterium]
MNTEAPNNIASIGERLKTARVERQISLTHVADELRLTEQMVVKLENDDYSAGPSPVFVRGYLRSYGKLLKLPEEEINNAIKMLDEGIFSTETLAVTPVSFYENVRKTRFLKHFFFVSFAFLVLMLFLVWHHSGKTTPAAPKTIAAQTSATPAPVKENEIPNVADQTQKLSNATMAAALPEEGLDE